MKLYILSKALRRNRWRVILAALEVAAGIAILTVTLSITAGAHRTVNQTLAGFGAKYLEVSPAGKNFTLRDARAISGISGITMISLQKSCRGIPVTYRNRQIRTDILGTDPNLAAIYNRRIEKGRFISIRDIYNQGRVCVITEGFKDKFFPAADYLDEQLEINGTVFRIIGCLEPMQMPDLFDDTVEEEAIMIPLTTSQKIFQQYDFDLMLLQYAKTYQQKKQMKLLKGRIERILKFHNGDATAYFIKNLDELVAKPKKIVLWITIIGSTLAALFLGMGGIRIRNLIFPSDRVKVRKIQNGKTIGTHEILGESFFISTAAGLAGLIFGIIGVRLLAIFGGMPVCITWWVSALGIGLMLLTGLASGFYRTPKTVALQPVEAGVINQ